MKKNYTVPIIDIISIVSGANILVVTSGNGNASGQIDDMVYIVDGGN